MNAIEVEPAAAEAAELPHRRSLQPLAGLAFAFGLLSALALVRTMFWFIPLVGVILGAVSLRLLVKAPEQCGRRLALLGMALAMLFGTWGCTRYYTRQQWLCAQARTYADAFVKLLEEKKFQEAHQLHGRGGQRPGKNVSLGEFYRTDKQARTNFNVFYGAGPLEAIYESVEPIKGEFVEIDSLETQLRTDQVVLRYHVSYDQQRRPRELMMRVLIRRTPDSDTGDYSWYVEGVREN
jgi:hypothetical protein